MSRAVRVLPVVLAVVLLSACGSGSGGSAAAGPSAPAASTSATTAPAPATSAAAAAASGDFCGTVRTNLKLVTGQEMAGLLAGGTSAAWKTYLDAAARANQQLVDAAPADIRPTVQTLKRDSDAIRTLLAAADYDTSKVKAAQLLEAVSSPEHTAASKAFVDYVKTSCGIDLSKPPA